MRMLLPVLTICGALAASAPAFAEQPQADIQFLNSGKVLPRNLLFSEAVPVGNTLYLSGQIGIAPGTLALVKGGSALQPVVLPAW